jgi:hypothetical protein
MATKDYNNKLLDIVLSCGTVYAYSNTTNTLAIIYGLVALYVGQNEVAFMIQDELAKQQSLHEAFLFMVNLTNRL